MENINKKTELAPEKVNTSDSIRVNESKLAHPWWYNFKYTLWGIVFGIVFVKAEILSWFRIQEMFRFQSFHMYGIIGTAVIIGVISVFLIKRFNINTIYGEKVIFNEKKFHKGQIIGGLTFGVGWAITGACPGPLFAHIGAGTVSILVVILSAIAGTWVYGLLREKLPH